MISKWSSVGTFPEVLRFSQQVGPNVSISANARVGAGVRLINCIILDDVDIKVWTRLWHLQLSNQIMCVHELRTDMNIFCHLLEGKCSYYQFNSWVEVIHWEMVPYPGKSFLDIFPTTSRYMFKNFIYWYLLNLWETTWSNVPWLSSYLIVLL